MAALVSLLLPSSEIQSQSAVIPAKHLLAVPYISEVPDGLWVGSWKNACEEASVAMVDRYYAGENRPSKTWAKNYMSKLFVAERKIWGSDANTDVEMTLRVIEENSSFGGRVAENVTVQAIKAEIAAGRPVIVPINGFTLKNPNIPFLASGSGYHMFVLIGYDDATGEFIANDNGDLKEGAGIRYSYERIMESLHDYVFSTKRTDGPQSAIFTFPKLAKTVSSHRIYFLDGGTKRYVSHPAVFARQGWDWKWVNVVGGDFLAGFEDGEVIRP